VALGLCRETQRYEENMGLLTGWAHRQKKKEVKEFVEKLKNSPKEDSANFLIMAYLTSAHPVIPSKTLSAKLIADGSADLQHIEYITLRILHYNPANQTPLIGLREAARETGDILLAVAMAIHEYTNYATAHEGYDELVKEMWNALFEAADKVESTFHQLRRISPDQGRLDSNIRTVEQARPDIPLERFLKDPRTITPHFLLRDSPITKHIQKINELAAKFYSKLR
jgi:hypothetical protein